MDCTRAILSRSDHLVVNGMGRTLIGTALLLAIVVCGSQAWAASVFGRAVQGDGSSPTGPCRGTLRAEVNRRGAPDDDLEGMPNGTTIFSVPVNQSGDFHFVAVPNGEYVLTVECATASAVRELDLQAGKEIRIDPPLLLEDLTLEVVVSPRSDPNGQPWQLTVDATMPRLRRIANTATTSADGRWVRRGLVAGNYRVNVSSSDGKPWMQRFFDLSAKSGPLRFRLPFMQVSGEVRLSTIPVRARLVFHNDAGGEPTTLTSDDSGFFQGLLPVTPGLEETKWTVEARAASPPISRRLTDVSLRTVGETSEWLDLELPMYAVHGTVTSEDGKPQSDAQVTFEEMSTGVGSSTATDDAGAFELQDLPPGQYRAVAESVEGVSARTAFQVVKGAESELKLVLNPSERVSFYLVSSHGPVPDAAVQLWLPPGIPQSFARTDQNGRFEVKLPPGTTQVGLTVAAQGYALKMTRLQISHDSDQTPDANTVSLDTAGGTLVVDLQRPGQVSNNPTMAYLSHNGTIEAIGTLVAFSTNQADGTGETSAVEMIEPGVYSLCLVGDPAELSALWFGQSQSNRCRTGSVEQGESLTLSLP